MIKWFWQNAIRSTRRGKFRARPWKLFFMALMIEAKSYLLTGHSVEHLFDKNPLGKGMANDSTEIKFEKDYYL